MKITKSEVERTACLARLELNEAEAERITAQLDTILSYVAKLDQLNTDGVSVAAQSQEMANAFREDEVQPSLLKKIALANGPNHNDESFVVPRIISSP